MKPTEIQGRISHAVQELGTRLLGLATSSWQLLTEETAVAQEIAKDPFTKEAKSQTATAELLIILLHGCDRIAAAAFSTALPPQAAPVLRNSFMAALVGVIVPAFARIACPEEDPEEQEETQADLLQLYNTRATQYGFFPFGSAHIPAGNEAFLKLAGIRIAEALECPGNPEVITHGVETVMESLETLRQQPSLKETIGQLIASLSDRG